MNKSRLIGSIVFGLIFLMMMSASVSAVDIFENADSTQTVYVSDFTNESVLRIPDSGSFNDGVNNVTVNYNFNYDNYTAYLAYTNSTSDNILISELDNTTTNGTWYINDYISETPEEFYSSIYWLDIVIVHNDTSFTLKPNIYANQGNIEGNVTDTDGNPISNATITLDSGKTTETDNAGYYRFDNLSVGGYALDITADGYYSDTRSVTVDDGVTNSVNDTKLNSKYVSVDITVNADKIVEDRAVNFTANVDGVDTTDISYDWYINGNAVGSDSKTLEYTFTDVGAYNISVDVIPFNSNPDYTKTYSDTFGFEDTVLTNPETESDFNSFTLNAYVNDTKVDNVTWFYDTDKIKYGQNTTWQVNDGDIYAVTYIDGKKYNDLIFVGENQNDENVSLSYQAESFGIVTIDDICSGDKIYSKIGSVGMCYDPQQYDSTISSYYDTDDTTSTDDTTNTTQDEDMIITGDSSDSGGLGATLGIDVVALAGLVILIGGFPFLLFLLRLSTKSRFLMDDD